ncbi:MAG: hypothetical protein A3G34_16135 [Candidatus Lindowbacteria bacterium RIFCSPLOWO2_12_FULL_62_27]|nr:MAG: hypothetical protein A3I06_12320 [Candidatus Lindowbacteria bacterium RIFCSPLOWO2_02_FULL_62_12]OGH61153.1 MAG: hypothetical protein A3G34_16135 [Candidatus Lindowbacteria bacterium RIFCSPLOWO2_12_FULL_62_27]
MRFACFICLIFASVVPARAEESYSLPDIVRRALEQNEQIAAFKARAEQKRLEAGQAKATPNPEIEYAKGRKKVSPSKGPVHELSVSQPILYPGKQALRSAVILVEADKERVRLRQTELAVALDVTRLAYEYGLARRKAALFAERQEHFKIIQTYLSGRIFAAPQKKAESQIVENRLRNLTTLGLEAQAAYRATFEKLNLLARLGTDSYPVVRLVWFNGRTPLDEKAMIAKSQANNLELAEQGLEAAGARKEADLAAIELMPDFSVSAFTQRERAVETERSRGMGIGLSIPIFNRNRHGIAAAKQRISAEESALAFQRRRVEGELRQSLAEYDAARQIVARYPETLLTAMHRQVEDAEEEFEKGRVELLVFLELDQEFAETVEHAIEAQLDLVESASEIFALTADPEFLPRIESF